MHRLMSMSVLAVILGMSFAGCSSQPKMSASDQADFKGRPMDPEQRKAIMKAQMEKWRKAHPGEPVADLPGISSH